MSTHPRRDTKPEMAVRRLIHAAGLRYRVDIRPLKQVPRRADLVFRGVRVAAFVDGCYWHGCSEHCRVSGRNVEWWQAKIGANQMRDADTDQKLSEAGWKVFRAWAHENPVDVAGRLIDLLEAQQRTVRIQP